MSLARRCWINQPSTLQPLHKYHGRNVIAAPYTNNAKTVYFLEGDAISMVVPSEVLAEGWTHPTADPVNQPASKTLADVADLVAGLESRLKTHDANLNDKGNAPTGGDYNVLFNEVIDLAESVRVLVDNYNNGSPDAELEIQRMLVVSTAHLPRQFREWLNAQNRCNEGVLWEVPPLAKNQNRDQEPLRLIVDPIDDYGWRICVTEEGVNEYAEAVHSHDPLLALLRLAQKHHCQWLAVDRDGDELDGFSTFED